MNLKLLSLMIDMTPELAETQAGISERISKASGIYVNFDNFYKETDFIEALSKNFIESDTILLFAEIDVYLKFKPFLNKIFKFKTKENRTLTKLIKQNYPDMGNSKIKLHSVFPVGAEILESPDGLYSSYMMKSEKQTLIVMPLDSDRTDTIFDMYVLPELKKSTAQMKIEQLNEIEESSDIEEKNDFIQEEQERTEINKILEDENKDPETKFIEICKAQLKTVALADTNTVDFIRKKAIKNPELNDVVSYSDYFEKNEHEDNMEYCKQLAFGAWQASSADIGLAITNVYAYQKDGQKKYYILVAAYDGEKYFTDRIDAVEYQSLPLFIDKAVLSLFSLATEAVVAQRKQPIDTVENEVSEVETTGKKKKDKKEKTSKLRNKKSAKNKAPNKKSKKASIGQKLAITFAALCFAGAIGGSVYIFLNYM
ncbi:MAG: hypothetical protein Q4E28_01305 [Clostridia bacterium]|nr:hypothetical protein [Clostridia bacterium]